MRRRFSGSLADRFHARLDKNGPVPEKRPDLGHCWIYMGSRNSSESAYPIARENGRKVYIHRFAYEHYREPIPPGKELHHLCENPACCNPWHTEVLTHKEHHRQHPDRWAVIASIGRSKTECAHGHPFSPENTYRDKKGRRCCRACARIKTMTAYRRKHPLCGKLKTHCPQGHEYTPENTYYRKRGGRDCRTCHRQAGRSRNARKAV
jgi:HNH endonuclease